MKFPVVLFLALVLITPPQARSLQTICSKVCMKTHMRTDGVQIKGEHEEYWVIEPVIKDNICKRNMVSFIIY